MIEGRLSVVGFFFMEKFAEYEEQRQECLNWNRTPCIHISVAPLWTVLLELLETVGEEEVVDVW